MGGDVHVIGAGDPAANGFYTRKSNDDKPKWWKGRVIAQDVWDRHTRGRDWYENNNGYRICYFADAWILMPRGESEIYEVIHDDATPPTEGWYGCSRSADSVPTLQFVTALVQ